MPAGKTELDEAIDRLEDADDWEDSSVNVHVSVPKPSTRPTQGVFEAYRLLTPWGRFFILVIVILAAVITGLAPKLLGAVLGSP